MTVIEMIRMLAVALDEGHCRPDAIVKCWDPDTKALSPVHDGKAEEWEVTLEARVVGE